MKPIEHSPGSWLVVIEGSAITHTFSSEGAALEWIKNNTPKPPEKSEPLELEDEPPEDKRERQTP